MADLDLPPTRLSSLPLVRHWDTASRSWQRRSCTVCKAHSCPPRCVWCRIPSLRVVAESRAAGWRSRPVAPEVGVSGSPGSDLRAKHESVSCSFQACIKCNNKKIIIIIHFSCSHQMFVWLHAWITARIPIKHLFECWNNAGFFNVFSFKLLTLVTNRLVFQKLLI